ncbi:hypothetical protein E2C01_100533 [Portunus trituberculatus]|uniref:Uncharacterized protein n=1 Tax=Portunus trituberculatus TaxID=210409 RepID=A0A5B7K394_PORTR|nr:hypothetical protein [Portunus trituberculatus]
MGYGEGRSGGVGSGGVRSDGLETGAVEFSELANKTPANELPAQMRRTNRRAPSLAPRRALLGLLYPLTSLHLCWLRVGSSYRCLFLRVSSHVRHSALYTSVTILHVCNLFLFIRFGYVCFQIPINSACLFFL